MMSTRMVRALTAFLGLLLAWSLLAYSGAVDSIFLPSPIAVLSAGWALLLDQGFVTDVAITSLRVLAGFVLGVATAIPLGVLIGTSTVADETLRPLLSFSRYLPVSGFIPLLILWTGIGFLQKAVLIYLGVVFHLALMVADDCKAVPRVILDTATLLGTSRFAIPWKVVLPYALPAILDDVRIILGAAWTYVLVAELVAATSGIGYVMMQAQRFLLTDRVMAGLLTIGLLGLVADQAFRTVRRRLVPWAELS